MKRFPRTSIIRIALMFIVATLLLLLAWNLLPSHAQSSSNAPWSWVSISSKVIALQGQKVTVTVNVRNTTTEGRNFGLHVWHGGPAWNGCTDEELPFVSWPTSAQKEYCSREKGCSFYWSGTIDPGESLDYQITVTTATDWVGYTPFAKVFDEDSTELVEIIMTVYPAYRQYLPLALHH